MTIYDRKNRKVETLIARETAPEDATETMFDGNRTLSQKGKKCLVLKCDVMSQPIHQC